MINQKELNRQNITRKLLKQSLIDLMMLKDYDKITAKEVFHYADVNRTTFYRYYDNIDDLLKDVEESLMDDIFDIVYYDSFDHYFENVCFNLFQNKELFLLLLHQGSVEKRFISHLSQSICIFGVCQQKDRINRMLIDTFLDYGIFHLLCLWLEEKMCKTPREIAEMIQYLIKESKWKTY